MTEDRTLQAILSRFYSCAMTRPLSPPIATIGPCCLLGLTFWVFDLAPKRNQKFGHCGLHLVYLMFSYCRLHYSGLHYSLVNKLVVLTSVFWMLRHYITLIIY